MTFKTAFKSLYTDFLEEYGYKYCNKLNYFVKVLNKELVFFIGYRGIPAKKGEKVFTIVAGIASIYYISVERKYLIVNEVELYMYSRIFQHLGFTYNELNMEEKIIYSFSCTKKWIMPIFEKVEDFRTYIEYKKEYGIFELKLCDRFNLDSLVLIMADNHDDFIDLYNEALEVDRKVIAEGKYSRNYSIEESEKLLYEGIIERIPKARDRVYADPDLLQQAHEEAERRKENNLRFLESCKIPL